MGVGAQAGIREYILESVGFSGGAVIKNMHAMQEMTLGQKGPWSRKWQPTSVFLPRKFYGQRSLVGCSLWSHKEQDTTKCACVRAHTHTHTVDLQCVSFRSTAEWFSYVYTVYLFLSRFFSHIGYNRILSQVPSTIQQVLVFYLFYIQQCVYINPQLLIYSSRRDLPSGSVVKKLPTVQETQV